MAVTRYDPRTNLELTFEEKRSAAPKYGHLIKYDYKGKILKSVEKAHLGNFFIYFHKQNY